MELIESINITQNNAFVTIPAGKYRGFVVHATGTNQAGVTTVVGDLGTLRLMINNRQHQFVSFTNIGDINNMLGGVCAEASAAGGAFNHVVYLPQHLPNDPFNILDVRDDNKVQLQLLGFYNVTNTLSGTIHVYGVKGESLQKYFLKIDSHDWTPPAGTSKEHLKGMENIARIFLDNDTNLTGLSVIRDGEIPIGYAIRESLYNFTHLLNDLETYSATTPLIDLNLNSANNLDEVLSESVAIEVTMGASSALFSVIFSVDHSPAEESASLNSFEARKQSKLAVKEAGGKTRTVNALQ